MRFKNTAISIKKQVVITVNSDSDMLEDLTVEKFCSLQREGTTSIYSNEYFSVDISNWDPNFDLIFEQDGKLLSNAISKYITCCLRYLHLDLTSKSEHLTFIGRERMREEANAIKTQIDKLGSLNFLGSHLTMSMAQIAGNRINLFTHEPIFMALDNLQPFRPSDMKPFYTVIYNVPQEALNQIKEKVSSVIDSEIDKIQNKIEQSASLCFAIDVINQSVVLDSKLVEYLAMNRHLLSSCPDLLFNSLLLKSEYTSDDLFGKGLGLKMKLLELSTRYKFNKAVISKRSFYSSFDHIVSDVYGIDFSTGIDVNDFEHYSINNKREGFDLVVASLTMTNILAYCLKYPRSEMHGSVLSIKDDKGIIFRVDIGKTVSMEQLIQLAKVCMQLTLVVFCKITINTLHETRFEANVLDLIDRSGYNLDA